MHKKKNKFLQWLTAKSDYYDYNLLASVILLVCFGLVMLYSTSAYESQMQFGDDMKFFRRQFFISAAAIIFAVFLSKVDYHCLIHVSGLSYLVALVLMAMVRFTPFGVEVYGARRWLRLGIQFQPSEVAKIAVIIYLPVVIIKLGKYVGRLKAFFVLFTLGLIQGLAAFILTDNLSTGLIIGGIAVIMIFIAHPKTWPFITAFVGTGTIVGVIAQYMGKTMTTSKDFRIRRILAWINPQEYMEDGGYQVMQGLYAIGSGGFFGKGLGNSAQKLGTIPEAQNDMIFSIVCEELGVFGAILLLMMFGYLLYRLFFIAQNAPDLYGTLIVSGVMIHIALQVILNLCVVLNIVPTTGITLPFVSYGGTSVVFLMFEVAIALSVSRSIKFKTTDEKTQK